MKSRNLLSVEIHRPVADVFQYAIEPSNTPNWIEQIAEEETDEWPVRVGTKYRNKNRAGMWSHYVVTAFRENELFEMESESGTYHVRYTFQPLPGGGTALTYEEWMNNADLEQPFDQAVLQGLKEILEEEPQTDEL